jgi:ribosomal protein L9
MSENQSPSQSQSNKKDESVVEINDALNEFYKLKSKYETGFYDKFVKPIITSKTKSKREKRIDYSKLPKPECVNCKRNVGSIFSIKNVKDDFKRLFTAKCGDLVEPCPFDITIEIADKQQLNKETVLVNKELNDIKTEIVKGKNDMMFGYIDQAKAISVFNVNSEELKEKSEMAGYVINTNITINDNPRDTELLKHLETDFGENFLLPFKNMIKEHNENSADRSKITEAIIFYKDEMMPKIAEIQRLKYKTDYIDYKPTAATGEATDLYFLVQRKNSLASLEFSFFSEDKLISNVKGIRQERGSATRSNREPIDTNKGTRKNRPLVELVEEKEEEAIKKDVAVAVAPKPAEIIDETDEQYKSDYDTIYNALSPKYKQTLSIDNDWLRKTMNKFIEFNRLKKAGKTRYGANREFVHPDGLLLPPVKTGPDTYDYGHEFYSNL